MDKVKYNKNSIASIFLSLASFLFILAVTTKFYAGSASLLLTLTGIVVAIIAVTLGIISIPQARERKESGAVFAVLGILVGLLALLILGFWLFGLWAVWVLGGGAGGPPSSTVMPTQPMAINATTTNQTPGLQTYTNSQYGFQFEYPTDWIINTSQLNVVSLKKDSSQFFSISIYYGTVTDLNSWDWNESRLIGSSTITVAGQNAVQGVVMYEGDNGVDKTTRTSILNGNLGITIESLPFEISSNQVPSELQYSSVYEGILSTLKFTK